MTSYGAFDLKFTSGNYDWDASNYEIGPFGRFLPLTTGNNRTMNNLGEIIPFHTAIFLNAFICWYSQS